MIEELDIEEQEPAPLDGSPFINNFVLTHLGEPICINEYVQKLAECSNIHVLQFNELCVENANMLNKYHIDPNAEFIDFKLNKRDGRKRHHLFMQVRLNAMKQFLEKEKRANAVF